MSEPFYVTNGWDGHSEATPAPDRIGEIEARLAKATQTPITHEVVRTSIGICHKIGPLGSSAKEHSACLYDDCYSAEPRDMQLAADADLFVHAPDDIRYLRDEVMRLREALNDLPSNALGRSRANFDHVPACSRVMDWIQQDLRAAIDAARKETKG